MGSMRTLVISDLHLGSKGMRDVLRQPAALDRLLVALRRTDRLVLLGDIVGYGADPAWAEKNRSENVQDYAKKEETYASRNTNGTGAYIIKGWSPAPTTPWSSRRSMSPPTTSCGSWCTCCSSNRGCSTRR